MALMACSFHGKKNRTLLGRLNGSSKRSGRRSRFLREWRSSRVQILKETFVQSLSPIYLSPSTVAWQELRHSSVAGRTGSTKRMLDISLSLAGLILLAPVLAVIAVLIKLQDNGSVLYRQVRVGRNGHRFNIVKFRTMSEDAEEYLGPVWSVPRDPRCTRLGTLLRRSGLDELPQLWNVLRGDMSIVGP